MLNGVLLMAGQQGGAPGASGGGIFGFFIPMIIVFVIFYFLLIRPQQKQAKKVKAMLDSVKKGDDVVTRSGIHGKIHGLADNIVTLEIAENVKIKINRDQVGFIKTVTSGS